MSDMPSGKSISELGTPNTYMAPDDLAIISEKQPNSNKYLSKAVKKEAFEKITINTTRDSNTRTTGTSSSLKFVDSGKSEFAVLETHAYTNGANEATLKVLKTTGTNPQVSLYKYVDGTTKVHLVGETTTIRKTEDPADGRIVVTPGEGRVEIYPKTDINNGGYIDFHNNGSSGDFTARIIDTNSTDFRLEVPANKYIRLKADANKSELVNPPTLPATDTASKAIATVGWVASNFLPASDLFDDPTELVNTLAGLLNKKTLYIYVHSSSSLTSSSSYVIKEIPGSTSKGIFENKDSTVMKPVRSIHDAIAIANGVKFLEGANCYIRLISDIEIDKSTQLTVSHPDLVQSKKFQIEGFDPSNFNSSNITVAGLGGNYKVRQIKYDLKQETQRYKTIVSVRCRCVFTYIEFYGGFAPSNFINSNGNFELTGYDIGSSCILVGNGGGDTCYLEKCRIRGCGFGVLGSNFNITNCSFAYCIYPLQIRGGILSTINNGVLVYNCISGFITEMGGNLIINTGTKFYFRAVSLPGISTGGGCSVTANLWNAATDQALVQDESGSITMDGVLYRRATSTEMQDNITPVVANKDQCGIKIQKITGCSGNAVVAEDRDFTGDPNPSNRDAYLGHLLSISTTNGYTETSNAWPKWVKAMSQADMGFAETTIPGVGDESFRN